MTETDYSTLKIILKHILKNNINYDPLFSAIERTNKLTDNVRNFIKAYFLYLFDFEKPFPIITDEFVRMVYKTLSLKPSRGRAMTQENNGLFMLLTKFKEEVYSFTTLFNEINAAELDSIIGYEITTYITNLENNIISNFLKSVKFYVRFQIGKFHDILIANVSKDFSSQELTNYKKELKKSLNDVIYDLIFNVDSTFKSGKTYHKWIIKHRKMLFPEEFDISYSYDIAASPQKYIKYIMNINRKLEESGQKQFVCFPLRHSMIDKSITIDTSSIIKLLIITEYGKETKQKYLNKVMEYRDYLWKRFFRLSKPIFTRKNYKFDYAISTNGYEVNIRYIKHAAYEKKEQEKKRMSKGRTQAKNNRINNIVVEKKIKEKVKIKNNKNEKEKALPEFRYVDELTDTEKNRIKNGKRIYIDPGKIRILTMEDETEKGLKYSCGQRLKETKRLEYQKKREKYAKDHGINKMQEMLTDYTARTSYLDRFIAYVSTKNIVKQSLYWRYNVNPLYKKLQWYSYINKQRSEARLIKRIKEEYGNNPVIFIGDWSETMPIKRISTPGIGMRRLLAKHFELYLVDEYNSSKLNYKTEEPCENLYLKIANKKGEKILRRIHSILTYQMSNKRIGCINRDINAVKNIKKIVESELNGSGRPEKYKRKINKKAENLQSKGDLGCQISACSQS